MLSTTAAGVSSAISRSVEALVGAGHRQRPFGWSDASRRVDVGQLAVCGVTGNFALQVTRPLCAGGPYFGPALARPDLDPRGELWLLDEHLASARRLSSRGRGVWSPSFSPDGRCLAALTLAGAGRVGLVIWDLVTGKSRWFLKNNIEVFLAVFRDAGAAYTGVCAYPMARRYLWADSSSILFVDHGDSAQEGFLAPTALSSVERVLRRRSEKGMPSARVWSGHSPSCGEGASLARLDCNTGAVEKLFNGDVRGVSVCPRGNLAAVLSVAENLAPAANGAVRAPLAAGEGDDALVRTRLTIVDIKGRTATQRFDRVSTVGAIAPSRLPVWSDDGVRVAMPARLTYSDEPSTGNDAAWEVDIGSRHARKWDAHSALDAELVSAMLTAEGLDRAAVLAARPVQVRPRNFTLGRIQGGAWRCSPSQVLFWNAPSLVLIEPEGARSVPGRFVWVSAPVLGDHGGRTVAVGDDGLSSVLSVRSNHWHLRSIRTAVDERLLGLRASDAAAVYVRDGDSGTCLLLEMTSEKPKVSPLWFNTNFADLMQPQRMMISHRFPDGTLKTGELQLPVGHRPGQRHPVIVYAYPDFTPSLDSPVSRLNSALSVVYPVQYLLANGFAFFHAPFRSGALKGSEPMRAAVGAVAPWLDVLEANDSVISGAFGFWGHSNAGYVALALEALSRRFKAIVAWDTFPEIGFGNLHTSAFDVALNCAGHIIQENRFLYEDPQQPFHPRPAPPWKNPRSYISNEPLFNLGNACTPLLLVEGEYDFSPRETEEVYSILRGRSVPVELAYYWGEGHVFGSPGNIRDSWIRTERFFSRYLRGRS